MQYHIIMIDYGPNYIGKQGPSGFEAVVNPEMSRRQIIEQVRDVLACDHRSLVHVKFIDGNYCEDVTDELIGEAGLANAHKAIDAVLSPVDRQAAAFDHARALRNEAL